MKASEQISLINEALDLIADAQELIFRAGLKAEAERIDNIMDELEHETLYLTVTELPEVESRPMAGINQNH